jgi:hypothetical protein
MQRGVGPWLGERGGTGLACAWFCWPTCLAPRCWLVHVLFAAGAPRAAAWQGRPPHDRLQRLLRAGEAAARPGQSAEAALLPLAWCPLSYASEHVSSGTPIHCECHAANVNPALLALVLPAGCATTGPLGRGRSALGRQGRGSGRHGRQAQEVHQQQGEAQGNQEPLWAGRATTQSCISRGAAAETPALHVHSDWHRHVYPFLL